MNGYQFNNLTDTFLVVVGMIFGIMFGVMIGKDNVDLVLYFIVGGIVFVCVSGLILWNKIGQFETKLKEFDV